MTGEGIVLPDEDQAEVDRRFAALEAELRPSGEVEAILARRVAIHSVRMDRCVREEAARVGEQMRNATSGFDDRRLAEAESLFDWIAAEPATNSRRLGRTPEGIDRMIKGWGQLAEDLASRDAHRWDYSSWQRIENLRGRRPEDFPISRDGALCKAIWNDPSQLQPGEAEGLDEKARRDWARGLLLERIAAELAGLRAMRQGFDHEAIAQDRAGAATRAIFDSSPEGTLARKYEAAAERGFYRALKELRQVQAEAEALAEDQPEAEEPPADDPPVEALGSIFPEAIDDRSASDRRSESKKNRRPKTPQKG